MSPSIKKEVYVTRKNEANQNRDVQVGDVLREVMIGGERLGLGDEIKLFAKSLSGLKKTYSSSKFQFFFERKGRRMIFSSIFKQKELGLGFNQNNQVNNGSIFVTECDTKIAYPDNFEDIYAPIKAGDILIAVNDISVTSTSHQRAAEMIRELGRPVTLTLERLPQIFDAKNVRKILDEAFEKEN